jgi:hypothetical protein
MWRSDQGYITLDVLTLLDLIESRRRRTKKKGEEGEDLQW